MSYKALELSQIEKADAKELLIHNDKCDKYDYLIAVGCGVIGGIIDMFLLRTPGQSVLEKWTDKQVDETVKRFAKISGWSPREENANNVASAIGFLEKKFSVNYDQRYTADVGNMFQMNTRNHHMMSLAHSPDIVGLFFSVLCQFTSTSAFVAEGQLIFFDTETFELRGNNLIAKLFSGVVNWIGHIMSDIAGSFGSRERTRRGTGISIPFYELFQFCKFGEFSVGKDRQDLATIAVRAFQKGYDYRFGLAASIPVIVTELSIKLIWSIRRFFQYGQALRECIPTPGHADLRLMLLMGNGVLCLMDGADAAIRSGGNALIFFTRLNFIGWLKLVKLALLEVCIRLGIYGDLYNNIEVIRKINEEIERCLEELKQYDIENFKEATKRHLEFERRLEVADDEQQLNQVLLSIYEESGYALPWSGDFNEHMADSGKHLSFR